MSDARQNGRWLLGLGGSDHDFSAALMHGHDIRVAIEDERISRHKHGMVAWFDDPIRRSIDYCLAAEGIQMSDVSRILSSDLLPSRVRHSLTGHQLELFPHHLCHAASAFLLLPPGTTAGVLVYDGFGSVVAGSGDPLRSYRETLSFFRFGSDGFECLGRTVGLGFNEQDDFATTVTNSVGMLYELVTTVIGFDRLETGKTMGLSAYGTPRYLNIFEEFLSYSLDRNHCFTCNLDDPSFASRLEAIMASNADSFAVKADLAATAQEIVNKTLTHCLQLFTNEAVDALCIAGGCGLNTVANARAIEQANISIPVVIPPYTGDAGISFGALWIGSRDEYPNTSLSFQNSPVTPRIARPGRIYSPNECRDAVRRFYPRIYEDVSIRSPLDLAQCLARGELIGLFRGGSEIGPRALGGRSILADPRQAAIRERLNRQVKHREPFRPLAPLVLQDCYSEYFCDPRQADPFMLKVARATARCTREAPAVVHTDGTARVQVLSMNDDEFLAEVLREFTTLTGVGILINTSFNRRGEPIVETPHDAVDAFLALGLDGLFLVDSFYRAVLE